MVDEVNGAEFFYYFVESEGNPKTDPFLIVLGGGPRCSVVSVLLFETGPLKFVIAPYDGTVPKLELREFAWTKMASILYVDSPSGNGFSFSVLPEGLNVGDVTTVEQVYTFLRQWFVDHPQYLSNPLYLQGESYAGKIVPIVASKVSQGIEAGEQQLPNLKGYMIGNPFTGLNLDFGSRIPYCHGVGILSDQFYEFARDNCDGQNYEKPETTLCAEVFEAAENFRTEYDNAQILDDICKPTAVNIRTQAARNRRFLTEGVDDSLTILPPPGIDCISYPWYLSDVWANNETLREALGIKKGTIDEWFRCDDEGRPLPYEKDIENNMKFHHDLTRRGYRALVYSGDHDSGMPFLGTQRWVRSLNFSIVDDWRAWHVEDQAAGFTITYANNMTFATVKGAGHTAPEYRPKECFAMVQRWLANESL